ncbi:uncharacterized protein RB166_006996 [Leptodactylus fuscus]
MSEPHDCLALMAQETVGFSHVTDHPLANPEFELFVDGSRYGIEGKFYTGYAVVTEHDVVRAEPLPPHMSAQEAELRALAEACKIAEGKSANIYTDSRYAFGIAHDYGPIWKARSFLTSGGKPIKNSESVKYLMDCLLLPEQVAVVKVKSHSKADTSTRRGNDRADQAAKRAAATYTTPQVMVAAATDITVSPALLKTLQKQASQEEFQQWQRKGATERVDGLWQKDNKLCLPRTLYPMMAQVSHGVTHQSKTAMNDLVSAHWFAPGFSTAAAAFSQACMICALNNQGRMVKSPRKHTPRPMYPFQRLQIDYIQMPKVGCYEYVLVCVDIFSGWPEAYAVPNATADY